MKKNNRRIKIGKRMKGVVLRPILLTLILLFPTLAFANVEVVATVDRNKMFVGDTFTYKVSVSISSSESMAMGQPKLPNIVNQFDVLNSWVGSESRSTFVNGDFQVKNTKNFNYILAPQKAGTLRLGATTVTVNGKLFKTKPISVTVMTPDQRAKQGLAQNQQRQRNQRSNGADDDLFSQLLRRHGFPDPFRGRGNFGNNEPIDPDEAFFIKVQVDKAESYVGEQVKASWYLYTRGSVRDIDTLKYPSLNGFWKEDIEVATRLNFTREIINGVPYNKALLASYALFPINPGPTVIDQYKARCGIILPSLGFGKTVKSVKQSQELTIQVNPLPADKPDNFTGGVGQFRVTSSLDVNVIEANQPVTLILRFEGMGNAKLINLPTLPLPAGLEMYDKNSEAKFFKNGKSFKQFKVMLIPREEGEVKIPPFTFSAFNPKTNEYYDIVTDEYNLTVKKGKPGTKVVSPSVDVENRDESVKEEYQPQLEVEWQGSSLLNSIQVPLLYWVFIYIIIFAGFVYLYLREMGLTQRKKTIQKLIQNRFKKIDDLSKNKDKWRDVGAELTNMMYLSLGAVSDLGGSGLEFDKMLDKAPPSVKRELAKEMKKRMRDCETLTFAPDAVVGNLKDDVRGQVKQVNKLVTKLIDMGIGENVH